MLALAGGSLAATLLSTQGGWWAHTASGDAGPPGGGTPQDDGRVLKELREWLAANGVDVVVRQERYLTSGEAGSGKWIVPIGAAFGGYGQGQAASLLLKARYITLCGLLYYVM